MGVKLMWKSSPSLLSYIPSAYVKEPAMSSDSMDNQLTCFHFLDAYEMGALLYVNNQLDIDL